jgi:polyisoprenoid-binding protein YceI
MKPESTMKLILAILICASSAASAATKKTSAITETKKTVTTTVTSVPVKKGQDYAVAAGNLEFFAIGKPSMLKIHGASTSMSGTLTKDENSLTGALEIPLTSFETGMKVRNEHLKEKVFETSKFDKAKLTITALTLPTGKSGELKDLPFTGKLNLHGVDHDVSGTATVTMADKVVSFDAQFEVKMSDYQIQAPEFMGMSMQDQIKITAKGDAKSVI